MSVLVLAQHDNKQLSEASFKTIMAASKLSDQVDVLVVGCDCAEVANETARLTGVNLVKYADNEVFEHFLAEVVSDLVVSLMDDYSIFMAPATTMGKNIAPRVSALIDAPQMSEITAIIDENVYERPIYAGNVIQRVRCLSDKRVITVRASAFDKCEISDRAGNIEKVDNNVSSDLSEFVSSNLVKSDRPELTSARVVISGGRGFQSAEQFLLLESIADKLNAAIGASRAAVDAGYVSNDLQVGQTGKVVAPDLYIAVGISGAIQHLAGMKDSKVIVAINKDDEAPIFQLADYGIVGDLFNILPELEKALG